MTAFISQWIESTQLAVLVGDSLSLTAWLSAVHLLGATLVGGSALVAGLRLLGLLFPEQPLREMCIMAGRGILTGLAISITTGALLFAPRASTALHNDYFQIKMLLLVAGMAFQGSLYLAIARHGAAALWARRTTGTLCVVLWMGVILAGSAFILLE